jgi:hypothetical protein
VNRTPNSGLLVETLTLTGARVSQLARCQIHDLVSIRDEDHVNAGCGDARMVKNGIEAGGRAWRQQVDRRIDHLGFEVGPVAVAQRDAQARDAARRSGAVCDTAVDDQRLGGPRRRCRDLQAGRRRRGRLPWCHHNEQSQHDRAPKGRQRNAHRYLLAGPDAFHADAGRAAALLGMKAYRVDAYLRRRSRNRCRRREHRHRRIAQEKSKREKNGSDEEAYKSSGSGEQCAKKSAGGGGANIGSASGGERGRKSDSDQRER